MKAQNDYALQGHLNGKKHLKKAQLSKLAVKSAMQSTRCELCSMEFQDEYALQGHLNGKKHLKKVQLSKLAVKSAMQSKRCELCSMEFQDEYALQGHLTGKKHLQKAKLSEAIERSIFVHLPQYIPTNVLLGYFFKYGAIAKHRSSKNYLIIEFADRVSTDAVLSKPVWINNIKLNVQRRILHSRSPKVMKPIGNECPINYDNIKHILEEETSYDDQLTAFLNATQLTDAEIETKYEPICIQLDKLFKIVFPKCKTYKFGSTQMGLGFKGCDLDIYMDIGEPIISESMNTSTGISMQKIFREVKSIMYRMNSIFSNIIPIPKAKIPIIKFCYVKTNISCDISFKNSFGIYKSNLMKFCISLDTRLKPLIMVIKYWARNFKISNYALLLLIIFYLQQPLVKIIPPLLELQKTCQPQIIDGWQVNFDENIKLSPITNTSSIPELLYGFFIFYSTFKFKSQKICPLDGMVHTESEFTNVENLPQCMDRYKACLTGDENLKLKVNSGMCVQDPIELNHNVTANTGQSTLKTFVRYSMIGAAICTEASKNNYKYFLNRLFSTDINEKSISNTFTITIYSNRQKKVNDAKEPTTEKNDWYYNTVFNIVKEIFEKVLKVQVVVLTADVEAKQQKIEVLSDVHTEKYKKLIFHCIGSVCTWRNRKINNIILDPSVSCLEKEAFISDQTIMDQEKEKSADDVNLDFMCTLEKQVNPLKVILSVSNRNTDEHIFQELTYFAKNKLLEIIKQTLAHIQQYDKCY
ncbi:poly(A) RNA polymerase, mitochondrial isoform X2 [Augochlora pura]